MNIPAPDVGALIPEIVVTLGAVAILILDFTIPKRFHWVLAYVAILTLGLTAWACIGLWGRHEYHLLDTLALDNFRIAVDLVILAGAFLAVLMSPPYLRREELEYGEYYALVLFAALGMMVMVAGLNLVVIFVGLETLSISLYVLAAFARGRRPSNEAGMKYLLVGAFATAFLLYGIMLIYAATGSMFLPEIQRFLMTHSVVGDKLLFAGLGLILVGFAFKVAAFPFHVWAPDVYEGAPTPVTAFMAVAVKAAAFAAFARVFCTALLPLQPIWQPVLWWLAVFTMTIGNLVAIAQANLKRMLAYSSIAHAGYAAIAIVTGSPQAVGALVYYLTAYTLMTAGAFGVVALLSGKGDTNANVHDMRGLGFRFPWIGAAMTLFMVSLAGFPPTAGFFAKFYLFSSAVQKGHILLVVVAAVNSVISVYYYLRVAVVMYMYRGEEEAPLLPARLYAPTGISVGLTAVAVLVLGLVPARLLDLARQSAMLALRPW
ncbi:MAG: NADH-quinone oxidoreductase subunit N [Armatimonadota bacterium]